MLPASLERGNKANNINRKLTSAAIDLLRDCGFDTTINAIIEYRRD